MPDPELDSRTARRWLFAVLAFVFVVFLPSIPNGYPGDDEWIARARDDAGRPRPMIAELQPIGEYFGSHWWRDHYEGSELYRPVSKLSIALVHAVAGKPFDGAAQAWPQHLVNLLVHLWATWLVYRLVSFVTPFAWAALAAALVFGVHALHTEAIALIVGRCDLLAFAFGAQALVLFVTATDAGTRPPGRLWRLGLVVTLLFLAFCSKEIAVGWLPFFPVFVLAIWLANGREGKLPARRAAASVAVCLPGLVAFLVLRQSMIASLATIPPATYGANPLAHVDALPRVLTAVEIQAFALLKTLFPIRLASDHGPEVFEVVTSAGDGMFLIAVALLGSVLAGGLLAARRHPLVFLAVAAFFGLSFVVSNVPFAIGTIFAERLYYLPSFGLAFAAAWLVGIAARRGALRAAAVLLMIWGAHNAVYAFRRSLVFEDTLTLAAHDAGVRPESANLQRLASEAARVRGDLPVARAHLERAAAIDPSFATSWLNLGATCVVMGDDAAAERAYRNGLARSRREMIVEIASLHSNLGRLLRRTGRAQEAIEQLRLAVELLPHDIRHRGFLLDALRQDRAAFDRVLSEGEQLVPGHPMWSYHRGRLAMEERDWGVAERWLRDAVKRDGGHGEAWIALALALGSAGKSSEALDICRRLVAEPATSPRIREQAEAVLQKYGR